MHRFRDVVTLLAGVLLLSCSPSNLCGEDFSLESLQETIQKTIKRVRPAVVSIRGRGAVFSGVIVSADGHVLSAAHAVTPGGQYQVLLPSGKRLRAVGKGSHSRSDAAMLLITRPNDDLPYVSMGDSDSLVVDQPVLGLSFPGGQKAGSEPVIRFGRLINRGSNRTSMLQSSTLMEPGDSGGPLFDLNGNVIGIHSRIGRSMTRNYEVPVNTYRKYWNELNRESSFTRVGPYGVQTVFEGLASKAGIKKGDLLLTFHGSKVGSFKELTAALDKARDDGVETVDVVLQRGEEEVELEMPFDVDREGSTPKLGIRYLPKPPEVALPENDHPEVPQPQGFKELRSLAEELVSLESKLDDACVEVVSDSTDEKTRSITGIRVIGEPWVVSKSSVVGSNPRFEVEGKSFPLSVVKRDKENDLVLLKAEQNHEQGIDLNAKSVSPTVGSFLLSPDAISPGTVSVLGTPAFRSRKQNVGFLGVMLTTYRQNQGARIDRVEPGAAKRAGLLAGDVITKMDDTPVRSHRDLRSFLTGMDPDATISATVLRDEEELTKSITLGMRPASSNHVANRMDKSGRRDGFQLVLSHDADLDPEECGGPLFDLKGNFVGLNIARNSRVRCYALPAETLLNFIRDEGLPLSEVQ